ncbi:MAG: phage Gp37/Gp68 family protein [Saccharothrix sp.]|nr:phage Gp37/Gp68 family protein [Saccharothrix sp.]
MNTTRIEWTDTTWNPVTGCTKVSDGCTHCYAETIATRFAGTAAFPRGFTPTVRRDRFRQPLTWRAARRVFVNSMSDLFHRDVPEADLVEVFAVMAAAERHTFQVLTKRQGRMRSLLGSVDFINAVQRRAAEHGAPGPVPWPLPNVWLGVSVETQPWADRRLGVLFATPAAVRFVSAEPLLGPVDLAPWLNRRFFPGLDWVIVGGESGPGARPMNPAWARQLRDQCQQFAVPFLFKQWGQWWPTRIEPDPAFVGGVKYRTGPGGGWATAARLPDHPTRSRAGRWDEHTASVRVGKTRAGRDLDGRTWDQSPPGPQASGSEGA